MTQTSCLFLSDSLFAETHGGADDPRLALTHLVTARAPVNMKMLSCVGMSLSRSPELPYAAGYGVDQKDPITMTSVWGLKALVIELGFNDCWGGWDVSRYTQSLHELLAFASLLPVENIVVISPLYTPILESDPNFAAYRTAAGLVCAQYPKAKHLNGAGFPDTNRSLDGIHFTDHTAITNYFVDWMQTEGIFPADYV